MKFSGFVEKNESRQLGLIDLERIGIVRRIHFSPTLLYYVPLNGGLSRSKIGADEFFEQSRSEEKIPRFTDRIRAFIDDLLFFPSLSLYLSLPVNDSDRKGQRRFSRRHYIEYAPGINLITHARALKSNGLLLEYGIHAFKSSFCENVQKIFTDTTKRETHAPIGTAGALYSAYHALKVKVRRSRGLLSHMKIRIYVISHN